MRETDKKLTFFWKLTKIYIDENRYQSNYRDENYRKNSLSKL